MRHRAHWFGRGIAAVVAAAILVVASIGTASSQTSSAPNVAVGPQYDSTHVYVSATDFDAFVSSFVSTFGGTVSSKGAFSVTPTPSLTYSQLALTPAGTVSAFGFQTPIPYLFGAERTGYLVTDIDVAVASARAHGAAVVVAPFDDPIGKDAVIEWPGGVFMQLYWHTTAPHYNTLATIPENRIYISPDAADAFIRDFNGILVPTVSSDGRQSAMVTFPGGYIAELHSIDR